MNHVVMLLASAPLGRLGVVGGIRGLLGTLRYFIGLATLTVHSDGHGRRGCTYLGRVQHAIFVCPYRTDHGAWIA